MLHDEDNELIFQLQDIILSADHQLSDILPSAWVEQNRMMTSDVSPIPGFFSYDHSPYTREIIDCLAPDHPARTIAVMKGAQIGFSTGVIEGGIGWIIDQNPGNILFLVGHADLVKDAGTKIDRMIDNSGIRHKIKSSSKRARNTKSGDTDSRKDYPGGYLKLGVSNHKTLRNISMQYGFIDDFESMQGQTKQSGSTQKMVEQRFAAYAKKRKLFYISTPELKETSNIEPVYKQGDQRKFHIPCPCCGEFIRLEWEIESEVDGEDKAGMTWALDDMGRLISESVGYTCYKCAGFFTDENKTELLKQGKWIPTAEPEKPEFYSYHISALYAPVYMFGWEHYVREYIDANPLGGERDPEKWKTFQNLVLGETYEDNREELSANQLQENVRPYDVGTIPDKISLDDGGGNIVLLTCAADLNGKEDDARLDWEIVAWNESGCSYSIDHGSIGTFIPKDPGKVDRARWTYNHGRPNSVWTEFDQLLAKKFVTDTGRQMGIMITGLDTGYQTQLAYTFIDNTNAYVVGIKGKDGDKYIQIGRDAKSFKRSLERPDLYLAEANVMKDRLAHVMQLKWNPDWHEAQPSGFMNYPTPSGGKYLYSNYFSHFEAEHRVMDKDTRIRWVKKSPNHQNHLFDCRLYNMVVKDILLERIFKELKIQNGQWSDFVDVIKGRKK